MLAMEIWNEAGQMEADALSRPSWASPSGVSAPRSGRVTAMRRTAGHALIGLGRLVAAEPAARPVSGARS